MDSKQRLGHMAMLAFSIMVAGSFIFVVKISNLAEPAAVNSLRFLIGAVLIGLYMWISKSISKTEFKKIMVAPWRFVILAGVFSSYFIFMFEGLKTAASVSSSVIFTLIPVMAAIFGYILLKQITTKRMALALFIGFIGAIWVIFKADMGNLLAFKVGGGELTYFLGCIAHAIFIPLSRKFNWGEKPLVTTFAILVIGSVMMGVYGYDDIVATDWLHMPSVFWLGLLYLAIVNSAITFFLIQYAALVLPSAKVMAYNFLTPVWVILLEVLLGNEWPPVLIFIGIAMTITALILLLKDEKPRVKPVTA
ncbi:MAG: DMT family transporter [Rhizobiales bacterium]|nr:DMT family transporter [Hyphomicrobiales bacterium]NRB15557.1 DMT family transporter [Hyphomicrobiales bacterium]